MKIGRAAKFSQPAKLPPIATVHLSCHCSPFLLFDVLIFLLHFSVSSYFAPIAITFAMLFL